MKLELTPRKFVVSVTREIVENVSVTVGTYPGMSELAIQKEAKQLAQEAIADGEGREIASEITGTFISHEVTVENNQLVKRPI